MVKDGKMKEIWEKMNQAEKWADEHEYQKLKNKVDALKNEKESYFRNREGSHPRVKKIEQELAELERKMKVFEDSAEQLKLMGITQDADPDKQFNAFIQKYGWPTNYEESKALLEKAKEEGIHPDYIHGMERGLKAMTNKDDDATEHGSIETYGKEKETETMPLEKNPVQAQDAYTPGSYDPVQHRWNVRSLEREVEKQKRDIQYHKERIEKFKSMRQNRSSWGSMPDKELKEETKQLEASYMKLQNALSMLKRATGQKDEAPTDVKDTKADGDPETMTTQEAREYWNKYHNSDPILEDYPNFEAWYRESKRNGYIVDEVPNHVQDSYEMLKLCGIVNDTRPLVGEVVEVDSPRVGQFTGRCVSVSSRWADIKILHMKNSKEPGIREGDIVSVNFEYIKV